MVAASALANFLAAVDARIEGQRVGVTDEVLIVWFDDLDMLLGTDSAQEEDGDDGTAQLCRVSRIRRR